jgi:hypothetical protein
MAQEQDAVALNQARNIQRESEVARQRNMRTWPSLEGSLAQSWPSSGCHLVRELELAMARRAVLRVLAMFESHYKGLDHMALSGGWAPGISDA